MFTINIAQECGCFKRSELENNMSFDNKDDALIEAKKMETIMNNEFCQKHSFATQEMGDTFSIAMQAKPQPTQGGCCGGGYC